MEIYEIADRIEECEEMLRRGRKELSKRATEKANALSDYDRALAKAILKLRNGGSVELDGETITNPPATIIERIARGVCYKEKLEAELSEAVYKNAVVGLSSLQAELNGYQTLFRYLDET